MSAESGWKCRNCGQFNMLILVNCLYCNVDRHPSTPKHTAQCDKCGRLDCSLAGGQRSETAYQACLAATADRLRVLKAVRPVVWDFAIEMERTLRDNDHKGGWEDEELEWLLEKLDNECVELRETIVDDTGIVGNQDAFHETVDVGNFAMMLADRSNCMGRELPADLADLRTVAHEAAKSVNLVDEIRKKGWRVAVHNDYHIGGELHTFWLFTRAGSLGPSGATVAVKGEGRTDMEALDEVWAKIVLFDQLGEAPLEGGS